MSNWAVVIGIDQYWREDACLKGAVRDALKMREWLIDRDGGDVRLSNLTLLLGPSAASVVPDGLNALEATTANVIQAVNRLIQRSGGEGERLYFYYSGHGITSRVAFADENCLVPGDFSDVLTNNSLTLSSIYEFFQATQFQNQFFFIDACRNIPWEGEIVVGQMTRPRRRDPSLPPVQQFICYATSPGVRAAELLEAGNERGAFTDALLAGLRGEGAAKAWDDEAEEYRVRWDNLFAYVSAEVAARRLQVAGDAARALFQAPREDGERGGGDPNPVLARFEAGRFPDVPLELDVDPDAAAAETEVEVWDLSDVMQRSGFTTRPLQFPLPPRQYVVKARARHFQPEKRRIRVDLYRPEKIMVRLLPGAAAPPVPGPEPKSPHDPTAEIAFRDLEEKPARLAVRSSDPTAVLEVADATGKTVASGQRTLEVPLPAGFYRARLRGPEGPVAEQEVDLLPGESETVDLRAPDLPAGPARALIDTAHFHVMPDNTLGVAEVVEPMATARLSTLLTLASTAANADPGQGWGQRLRSVGLRAFRDAAPGADSGIQVLFGCEHGSPEARTAWLAEAGLGVWRQGEPAGGLRRNSPLPEVAGVAEFLMPASPGQYWLSFEWAGRRPVVVATTLLPGRLSLWIYHRDAAGQERLFHYLPRAHGVSSQDPEMMRRLELTQRFYLGGRPDDAYRTAMDLLYAKWEDPIAGCLGGYLMLKLGKTDVLDTPVNNMANYFGQLADSQVLLAAYEAGRGRTAQARAAYLAALDLGVPLLADGLALLLDGVAEHQIAHPRVTVLNQIAARRVPGLLWTAWVPAAVAEGQPVEG